MTDREPRRRAVTPEWAAHVSDDLHEIKTNLARLLAHHGIGDTPAQQHHHDDRGHFSPGTGWYPDTPPPVQYEPRTDPDTMTAWLGRARDAIKRAGDDQP